MLTRQFQVDWLKVAFLGEVEAAVRYGVKSLFAHMELGTSDSILRLLLLFLTNSRLLFFVGFLWVCLFVCSFSFLQAS